MPRTNGVTIQHHRVDLGGVSIAYDEAGAGAPLILVHGLSGSARWWAKNVPALARRFRVLAVDLVGFGGSRGGPSFVLTEAAGELARWMDHLGLDRASVVGHSMGGFIAADLAAEYRRRVDRLVLADAAAIADPEQFRDYALGLPRALRYTPLRFLPLLAADAYRAGPATIWQAARQLLTTDLRPKLARIEAPTLLVWGEHDTIVPPAIGERLARELPDARFALIPGAGHNAMWDRPEAFNRLVAAFLATTVDADASDAV